MQIQICEGPEYVWYQRKRQSVDVKRFKILDVMRII